MSSVVGNEDIDVQIAQPLIRGSDIDLTVTANSAFARITFKREVMDGDPSKAIPYVYLPRLPMLQTLEGIIVQQGGAAHTILRDCRTKLVEYYVYDIQPMERPV